MDPTAYIKQTMKSQLRLRIHAVSRAFSFIYYSLCYKDLSQANSRFRSDCHYDRSIHWRQTLFRFSNLYHSMAKVSKRQIDDIFLFSSKLIGFDISYKLSQETICKKCQCLFSRKNISKCRLLNVYPAKLYFFLFSSVTKICSSHQYQIVDMHINQFDLKI